MSLFIKSLICHGTSIHQKIPDHFTPASDFTYTSNGSAITITGYKGSDYSEISIPNTIDGLPVRTIADGALAYRHLKSIIIPNSVTYIGFYSFGGNNFSTITIPSSVEFLGTNVVGGNPDLTSINVESNNEHYLSMDGVLFNKARTILLAYPAANSRTSYIIPDGVVSTDYQVGQNALYLTNIIFPASITTIGFGNFSGNHNLISASFMGNAPSWAAYIFYAASPELKIYYPATATGWTTPTWNGYTTVPV